MRSFLHTLHTDLAVCLWLEGTRIERAWMQHASAARLRCDPTDYARKQQEKKDRAKELKEQRSKGFVDDDHTFAPKCVPAPSSSSSYDHS